MPGDVGTASALKMAYAAWTKGSSALLIAVRALAIREGVDDALRAEWERSQPGLGARSESAVAGNARKAWRFVGEMEEIARDVRRRRAPGRLPRGVRRGLRPSRPLQGRADAADGRRGGRGARRSANGVGRPALGLA